MARGESLPSPHRPPLASSLSKISLVGRPIATMRMPNPRTGIAMNGMPVTLQPRVSEIETLHGSGTSVLNPPHRGDATYQHVNAVFRSLLSEHREPDRSGGQVGADAVGWRRRFAARAIQSYTALAHVLYLFATPGGICCDGGFAQAAGYPSHVPRGAHRTKCVQPGPTPKTTHASAPLYYDHPIGSPS